MTQSHRNGSTASAAVAPNTDELANLLVQAKATGQLDNQIAPALVTLLEQVYSTLSSGQVADATAKLQETLGPALALGQARQTLVASLVAVDTVLLDYQRRRGPSDAAMLPTNQTLMADLAGRLHQIAEAAEDAATRAEHYLRLIPAPRI
jgi:hypothetical protein